MMTNRQRQDLDRHITGNYGEDSVSRKYCIWEDCDQEALYCEGHAEELMLPKLDALRAENTRLRAALEKIRDASPRGGSDMVHIAYLEEIARAALAQVQS
jgi:hypothetical protein